MNSRHRIHAAAIHYFDAVRHARSIRGAAAILNVASSAVNRQILNLEAGLGMQLFERAPSGLKLTAAGEIFARHVNTVLTDSDRMKSELDALSGLHSGHVDIATIEGLCHDVIPEALDAMRARHPRVTVKVSILSTNEIPEAVLNGDAHLGLAFHFERRPELRQIAVGRFTLGAVVDAKSPLAGAATVSVHSLADANLILPAANFAAHAQLWPLLLEANGDRRPLVESGSIELMKHLARQGVGIGLLTRVGLTSEIKSGTLAHVPLLHKGKPIFSELGLYARKSGTLPVAVNAMAQYLGEIIVRRQSEEPTFG